MPPPIDLRDQLQRALGSAFTLERELGGGGMSHVFLAEETALRRKVVVKILPPEMSGQVSIDRFQREIALAATLQHAHIVPLLTAGDADGLPYFTMPYIRGESLRARITKQGELPVAEAMRILREVASALAFAHDAGVVHRDIKPDNVLIAGGAAMVTDFGVAKALSESTAGGGSAITSLGIALGTPAYMAPEQASADPLTDHRADIYAWGILAYELLTGGTPFSGRPASALLAAHVQEAPEPVSRRRANLPPELASLVMRCLAKRAADRPQSGAELVRALDAMVTPTGGLEPTSAHVATVARPPVLRQRGVWIAVACVALAAAVYVGTRGTGASAATPRSIAVLPFENKTGDSAVDYLVGGLSDLVRSQLSKAQGLTVMPRTSSVAALDGANGDTRVIGEKLGVGAVLHGTVIKAAGRLQLSAELVNAADGSLLWSELYNRDVRDFPALRDSIVPAVATKLDLSLTSAALRPHRTEDPEARDLYLRGYALSFKSTEAELRQAQAYFERALAKDPAMAEAYAGIGWTWGVLADAFLRPADAYPKMKVAALKAIQLDSTLADGYFALAGALAFHDWNFTGAELALRQALARNPQLAEAHSTLATILSAQGKFAEAVTEANEAVKRDPFSVFAGWQRALVLYNAGRFREALAQRQRDIAMAPSFFYLEEGAGAAYRELGLLDSSIVAYERAKPFTNGQPQHGLAITYARAGRQKDATDIALALEEWSRHHYFAPDLLATTWATIGDMDRAFRWLERVFETRSSMWALYGASPDFAPLRRDPRWAEFERRTGRK